MHSGKKEVAVVGADQATCREARASGCLYFVINNSEPIIPCMWKCDVFVNCRCTQKLLSTALLFVSSVLVQGLDTAGGLTDFFMYQLCELRQDL